MNKLPDPPRPRHPPARLDSLGPPARPPLRDQAALMPVLPGRDAPHL